jgi:hypothetical protein
MAGIGEDVLLDAFRSTAPLGGNAWALFAAGSTLTCEGYRDGFRLGVERASVELIQTGTPNSFQIVPVDQESIYGDDSFLWGTLDDDGLMVGVASWDPAGGINGLDAFAGTCFTAPVYLQGWVYWANAVIVPGEPHLVQLNRARIDFSEPEEVWEIEIEGDGDGRELRFILLPRITHDWFRFTASLWDDESGEALIDVAVALSGGAPLHPDRLDPPRELLGYGVFHLEATGCLVFSGRPLAAGDVDAAPYLLLQPNDGTSNAAPVWPDPQADAAWITGWSEPRSLGLARDLNRAILYGVDVLTPAASVVIADPVDDSNHVTFPVEDNPDIGFPDAYFFASI